MTLKPLRLIAVSQENYLALKRLGSAGDSFNDVISEILKKQKPLRTISQVGEPIEQSPILETKNTTYRNKEECSDS